MLDDNGHEAEPVPVVETAMQQTQLGLGRREAEGGESGLQIGDAVAVTTFRGASSVRIGGSRGRLGAERSV